jgi:hypothetical protein
VLANRKVSGTAARAAQTSTFGSMLTTASANVASVASTRVTMR